MPATAVKTAWSGGNLYFYDKSGNVIFYIDGTNRSMVFASGAGLTAPTAIDATDIAAGAVTYDKVTVTAGNVLAGTKTTNIASLVDVSAEGALLAGQGAGETPAAVTLSGDVTMAKTGAVTIAAKAVEASMIALAAGSVFGGTKTTGAASAVDISAEGALVIGQGAGETPAAATLSGDVTMAKTGAVTIAAKAVENTMIAAAAGTILVGTKTSGDVTALDISAEGAIPVGQGAGETALAVTLSGDVTMAKTGAVTIASGAVDPGMQAVTAGNVVAGTKTTNVGSLVDISAEGAVLVGQGAGETPAAVTLSSDVTMAKTGAVTIAALAVTAGKLAAAVTTMINGLRTYLADGMLQIGTLTISATAEKFKTTTEAIYTIAGLPYTYPATDDLVFSAANTINTAAGAGTLWGIWLVQINAAGTVSTKPAAADMTYATEAAAIAALPAVDASNVQLGYITVQALEATDWVANTDNLTVGVGAGNCTARSFYDLPAAKSLPAAL